MTIRYKVLKSMSNLSKDKYYAIPSIDETIGLEELAEHMSEHNSPYSKGVIMGLLTDMVACIKEQLLEGKNVKLDNLAIFSVGIKNKRGGAETEEAFTTTENISGVKLRARATGTLSNSSLDLAATLKKVTVISATGSSTTDSADTSGGSSSGGSTSGGSTSGGSSSDTSDSGDGGFQG